MLTVLATCAVAPQAAAQALSVTRLEQGTELVHVALPMTGVTSVAWPDGRAPDAPIATLVAGTLTLVADLESAFAAVEEAPPVVVSVGAGQPEDIRRALERLLGSVRAPLPRASGAAAHDELPEGAVERRLGPPGADSLLRLRVGLPAPEDWRRSEVEVLWELLPSLLSRDRALGSTTARIDGEQGVLELRVEPELAEVRLASLRLQLSRIGGDPDLDPELVEAARSRLRVRRLARLEQHPEGADTVLRRWLAGGGTAVREHLFGLDGVTVAGVRIAAREWLPLHPGAATVTLPPRVFSPRFAGGPLQARLDNDLSVAVLERPTAPLSAICLRPVLVSEVDGGMAATVLARLAAVLRSLPDGPGFIRVATHPVRLELASEPDRFAELLEAMLESIQQIAQDEDPVSTPPGDARWRALALLAGQLGLDPWSPPSPADLLRPDNLGLGMVAPDAETALDAAAKFLVGGWGRSGSPPAGRSTASSRPRREAVAGGSSAVAVAVELPTATPGLRVALVEELLRTRLQGELGERKVSRFDPLIPGRQVMVLLVEGAADLDKLEDEVRRAWQAVRDPVTEDELSEVGRRIAASRAATAAGAVGRACVCAEVATGTRVWRTAGEEEMDILRVDAADVSATLRSLAGWTGLEIAGAGVLPIGGGLQ